METTASAVSTLGRESRKGGCLSGIKKPDTGSGTSIGSYQIGWRLEVGQALVEGPEFASVFVRAFQHQLPSPQVWLGRWGSKPFFPTSEMWSLCIF